MGRPAATEEQRREQRNRIRHAAAAIYQEDGVGSLSVRAIAKRAGVSTGLLYSYFSNVSELMRSLWLRPVAEFGTEIERIVAATPQPIERIESLLTAYVSWAHAHPDVYRGVLLLVRPPTDEPLDISAIDEVPIHRALRDAIVEAQAAGTVRDDDPELLAQVLWAGVHGALALPVNLDRFHIARSTELASAMIATLIASLSAT